MVLIGHTFKDIERKVKRCRIEEGMSPEDCLKEIEEEYELEEEDRIEIMEIAKQIGKF